MIQLPLRTAMQHVSVYVFVVEGGKTAITAESYNNTYSGGNHQVIWKYLQSSDGRVFFVERRQSSFFCRFVPESFRWYVGHDRIDDAKRVIRKMAKFNGKPLPDMDNFDDLQFKAEKEQEIDDRKYTFFDLVRTTHLRKITLLFLIIWRVYISCCLHFSQWKVHNVA